MPGRKRSGVVAAIIAKIQAANLGFASVNRGIREANSVRDRPSCDVFAGTEVGDHLPAQMVDGQLRVIVRIYAKRTNDLAADQQAFDDLLDGVKHALRGDQELGGLTSSVLWKETITDLGWLGFQGKPALGEVHFDVEWEQEET